MGSRGEDFARQFTTGGIEMRRLLLVVLGLCLTTGYASAQTFASITGEVKDSSGGLVPNVTVTATNTGTNAQPSP